MHMILVPAVITLAVTLLRLTGELQQWSPALFGRAAGGGGSLVGISWLIPIFGIYFALKLVKRGEGPAKPGRALGLALLAIVIVIAAAFGGSALKLAPVAQLGIFAVLSWVCIAIAFPGWPALARTLLAYGFAARIPVAVVMLFAIFGNWGTHYDVAPPDAPQVAAMAPLTKWFWIGLVPQLTIWIYTTVVGGMICGAIAAAIARKRSPATA
jgi:hypothetical protein